MTEKAEKKKLLYVITKANWGGAGKYVYELAAHFALSGKYDVAVALGGEGALKVKLQEAGVRTIDIAGLKRDVGANEAAVFRRLYKIFKEEHPDIVHLNSSKIGAMGSLAARMAGVPKVIFTAHGWAFHEEWRPAIQRKIILLLSFITVLLAHKTIVISQAQFRQTPRSFFVGKKIIVVNNGILPPMFQSRDEARRELGIPVSPERNPVWIGTIGELHKNKGHIFAIEAIRKITEQKIDAVFAVIGEGEERERLAERIAKYGLEKHFFLLGNQGVLEDKASALLTAFDIFLFPSLKEGHPYAILEAGLAGLPCIASGVGGIIDVITDMESGILVRPKDADEIVRAIRYLLDHPELAEKFAKRLHQKVLKQFSFAKMARETGRVYGGE